MWAVVWRERDARATFVKCQISRATVTALSIYTTMQSEYSNHQTSTLRQNCMEEADETDRDGQERHSSRLYPSFRRTASASVPGAGH